MKSQKKEITWNLINSVLAGGLVLLGACSGGNISWDSFAAAFIASAVVALSQFRDYWTSEKAEYSTKLFKFL
jgi:hypothetical protein